VPEDKDFQARLQTLGSLLHDLETIADPASRSAAKELVQLLMDLHGSGLERILEIVFQSGEVGGEIIDKLGRDSLVSSLLVLYGLHPEELQTRVERKLEQIRSKLHKMGAQARLVSVNGTEVRLHVAIDRHSCGSTARSIASVVEEAMYEAAPDLTSLVVEGLEEPSASGFVALEKLSTSSPTVSLQATSAEGMD
jgi:hypothetical protein